MNLTPHQIAEAARMEAYKASHKHPLTDADRFDFLYGFSGGWLDLITDAERTMITVYLDREGDRLKGGGFDFRDAGRAYRDGEL